MRSLLRIVGGAVVGGLIAGLVMGFAGFQFVRVDGTAGLLLVAGFVPVVLLTIAIHEAGHLLAGAAVRFRPCLFIVGPLKLERPERRWRIGINRRGSFCAGLSAGIPDSVHDLRRRLIVLIAGGPAASAFGGLCATVLLVLFRPSSARSDVTGVASATYLLLIVFALMSFLTAFIALVPGRKGGQSSDGAQIGRFLKNDDEVEADVSLTALSLASLAGRRPRDWDQTLLARALTLPIESGRGVGARRRRASARTHSCARPTRYCRGTRASAHGGDSP